MIITTYEVIIIVFSTNYLLLCIKFIISMMHLLNEVVQIDQPFLQQLAQNRVLDVILNITLYIIRVKYLTIF